MSQSAKRNVLFVVAALLNGAAGAMWRAMPEPEGWVPSWASLVAAVALTLAYAAGRIR
jgi:hypothetical protein